MEKIYRNDIKIKPIDNQDPDALTHLTHPDGTRPLLDNDNEINQNQDKENLDNTRSSRQSASGESVNQDSDKEVKCPYCDYVERPFYLKIHVKNAHEGEQN